MSTVSRTPIAMGTHKHSRRASNQTETTVTESSDDFLLSPVTPVLQKKKRRNSKKNQKMFMGLIAQEMVISLDDTADNAIPTDCEGPQAPTLEDIFYAQMNGEHVGGTPRAPSTIDEESQADDNDTIEPKHTDAVSKATDAVHSQYETSRTDDDTLSVAEIKDYVMNNLPEKVKDKISEDAWVEIFGNSSSDRTRRPSITSQVSVPLEVEEDDDNTMVSDITEFDFASNSNRRASLLRQNSLALRRTSIMGEQDDSLEFDICPTLAPEGVSEYSSRESRRSLNFSRSVRAIMTSSEEFKKKSHIEKRVSFDAVNVRYYERILDVNPAVTNGAAIGIGWRYKRGGTLSVDEWELRRSEIRKPNDLVIPRHIRDMMLIEIGYTKKDIAVATRIILKAKNQRRTTVHNLGTQGIEEAVESASRRVKALLSFGKKKGLVRQ